MDPTKTGPLPRPTCILFAPTNGVLARRQHFRKCYFFYLDIHTRYTPLILQMSDAEKSNDHWKVQVEALFFLFFFIYFSWRLK